MINTIPEALTRWAGLIDQELRRRALPATSPLGLMSGYHMGWVDAEGRPREVSAGKRVRPGLCVWAATACGAEPEAALPAAAAIELMHNFTLVHDDIQDRDLTRRGRPTVWAVWGQAQGINAGDGLHALALQALLGDAEELSSEVAGRRALMAQVLTAGLLDLIEGQCLDLQYEGRPDTPPEAYLRMVEGKTGALLGAALEAGATAAGVDAARRRRFGRAGRLLGLAFQLRDDWLGIWGDPELTGKSTGGDLARRKLTYPVVAAYAAADPEHRRELERLYAPARRAEPAAAAVGGGPRSSSGEEASPSMAARPRRGNGASRHAQQQEERRIREVLLELGGPELTEDAPASYAAQAVAEIERCRLDPARVEEFADVATYIAKRRS